MNASQIYIAILLIALFIIFILVVTGKKNLKDKRLSLIASLAFIFILSGIIFGENRLAGYILLGIGIILSVIDIYMKR